MNEHNPDLTLNLREDMSPAARRAYIQKWIAKNQRRMAAGLGATLMTLPLLAQAQSVEGMVNALDIAGVRSVALNSDGTVQLTLSNGQQVQVAASSVQVAADGTLLISAAAAELVAEVAAGIAASGAAAGGVGAGIGSGGIAAVAGGIGLAAAAAAGGGSSSSSGSGDGGSSSGGSGPQIIVLNATAITDTRLQAVTEVFGALPELEDGDRLFFQIGDNDEFEVTIDVDGSLIFPNAIELDEVQGQRTLSYRVERTSTVEGEDEEGNSTSETVTETVASGSAVVRIDTIPPEIEITTPIAGDDILNAAEAADGFVIEGTAEGVENGQMVTLTLNGTEFTARVSGEAWSLTITQADIAALGLESGANIVITANVSDAAGNPALEDDATVATDFIAEISIEDVVIETVNTFIGVTIRGETVGVEEGQPVTLTFNGTPIEGVTVQADGTWSAFVAASVIESLGDGAEVSISASVADIALNSDSSSTTATTDFSTPPVAITSPATGGFINAEAAGQSLVVEGVTLPDAQVTVTLAGGATRVIDANDQGIWDTSFASGDLPADEGDFVISASILIEGVQVPAQDVTLTKDTEAPDAPELELAQDTGTVAGETSNGTVNITNLEDGASAEYSLDGGATWTDVEGSSFTLTGDGEKAVIVRQTDVAGNISANSPELGFTLDTDPPTVTVTSLAGIEPDGALTANELYDGSGEPLATVILTGTATGAVDGAPVTVLINGTALALGPAPTVTGEAWSANIPVTALAGLETIEVRTVDGAGNEGTGTAGFTNDVVIPTITVTLPANEFVIGLDEYENGFTISGTTTDVPDGPDIPTDGTAAGVVTITITANDGSIDPFVQLVSVQDGAWEFFVPADQLTDVPDLTEFELSVSVSDGIFPIAVTDEIDISTNIPPEITLNVGEDGALIVADVVESGEIFISGTTRGVQEGQRVTVFAQEGNGDLFEISDTTDRPVVDAEGNWSVSIPIALPGTLSEVLEFTFKAEVSNASGTPADASETVVTYQQSSLYIDLNEFDTLSTFNVFVETDRLADPFLFVAEFSVSFDPSIGSFDFDGLTIPTAVTNTALQSNRFNLSDLGGTANVGDTGVFSYALGSIRGFDNLSTEPMVGFGLSGVDASSVMTFMISNAISQNFIQSGDALADTAPPPGSTEPVGVNTTDKHFGPSVTIIGTNGIDNLSATNVDTFIRGRGGDDEIDVSAAGVNTIIFEAGSNQNGFDTITGFTLGGVLADRIAIDFNNDRDTLRGDGTDFQVTDAGPVGADVGFLVFTTAVANFDNATIDAALTGLTGLNNGDDLYLLVGNGEDAILTAIEVSGGTANVSTNSGKSYAEFKDIGDLSGFSSANIIGFEQYNA